MGLRFLAGKSWAEITREERVFCQHLYALARELGSKRFVGYLNDRLALGANADANWEMGYEVCFYRDLWHLRGREGEIFSQKRTFDLCLFSDDHIILIEAKAQQAFDEEQVAVFVRDKEQLVKETGVARVSLLGLGSSRCVVPQSIRDSFDAPVMKWRDLAELFDGDPILLRADDVYDEPVFAAGRNSASGKMTGQEIVHAHAERRRLFVGRGGGLNGAAFREDVKSQRWRRRKYETNDLVSIAPNEKWFSIDEFVAKVGTYPSHGETSETLGERAILPKMNAVRGRVRGGRIELDGALPEGAEVVVLAAGHDEPFDLDDAQLAEIETRLAAADRGEVEPAGAVLEKLRRSR